MEGGGRREEEATLGGASAIKRGTLSFGASLKEGSLYVNAFFIGLVKKLTARTEKEASEADLQESRMQVQATDEAQRRRSELSKS